MIWIETREQADADNRRAKMWGVSFVETPNGGLSGSVNGEGLYEGRQFWSDAIKATRNVPLQRLEMGKRHLPLPAAFREVAIALRSIIRARRKLGEPFDDCLRELHWFGAIQSLAWYDDLDITPFSKIESLDLSPQVIGWNELPLLNKTDRACMSEMWTKPDRHTTGEALYPEIKREGSAMLREHREATRVDWLTDLDDEVIPLEPLAKPSAQGFLARFFGLRS